MQGSSNVRRAGANTTVDIQVKVRRMKPPCKSRILTRYHQPSGEMGPEGRADTGGRRRDITDGAAMDVDVGPLGPGNPNTPFEQGIASMEVDQKRELGN